MSEQPHAPIHVPSKKTTIKRVVLTVPIAPTLIASDSAPVEGKFSFSCSLPDEVRVDTPANVYLSYFAWQKLTN